MPYDPLNPYGTATSPITNQQFMQALQPKMYESLQPSVDLTRVNGIEGANAYPTKPNSRYALFDINDDIMFIKQTDAGNFPTITRYRYILESEEKPSEKYVTIEEFEKFKEEVLSAKQSGRSKSRPNDRSSTGKGSDANPNVE